MSATGKILIIDDDAGIATTLQMLLEDEGYTVAYETRGDRGLARAQAEVFDTVLTDLRLPGLSGLDLVRQLHAAQPRLPIILMTAHGSTETAIEATKFGAYDYLLKPFKMPELMELAAKAVASSRMMSEPVTLGTATTRDAIIGNSRAMQTVYKEIGRVVAKPVNVLIRGETGTGKELIARAIYQHGERAKAPFVAINCAAIPETLLESELFGHERGAFTGAESRRIGRFEQADRGTIFLDEIGDMTPGTQVKLLRVVQERTLQRLGGKETIPVDVRIIAATHRDLEAMLPQKLFREDLYYRLSVVVIQLPRLRDRIEDLPDLVRYFVHKYGPELCGETVPVGPDALEVLRGQPWPGNVRELENVVRKMLLLCRGYPVDAQHARAALNRSGPVRVQGQSLADHAADLLAAAQRGELDDAHARLLKTAEQELLTQAIRLAQGNQARAARWLGISRFTLREKLTQFGLRDESDPSRLEDVVARVPPAPGLEPPRPQRRG
jgi:DNA-binding NtrC family response regulator